MLQNLGYRVETRTDALDALEAFRADPDGFDVVITDMTMPRMTGERLAGEIMRIRKDIPVILCTGFCESMTEARALELGIHAFAMKPVARGDIAQKIRKVLEGKGA
jgi:DNA-binding NtrC family response regulator